MSRTAATARLGAMRLDQRITLQRRDATQDELGTPAGPWLNVGDVWAQAQPLRGREFFASGQMQAQAEVRFVIRWRCDVHETWAVMWRGQPHEIVAPPMDIDGQQHFLELMCTAGLRDGR